MTGPAGRRASPVIERPPVRQATLVRSDRDHTFDGFVRLIGAWWPIRPYSAGGDRVERITFERQAGGRVYETWDDGTTIDWGEVLRWDPPNSFVISWRSTPAVTEVEVTFAELGPALTRVAVEHRGWEALSADQLAEDCALPGGYLGGAYSIGWSTILRCLADSLEARTTGEEHG